MLNLIKNLSIGKKIAFGFSVCLLISALSILITIHYVNKMNVISSKLVDLRIPTAQNTATLLNGVNHSLAALRGWIILGNDKFKVQRQVAWDNLEESIHKMDQYSKNWTNPKNVETATFLKSKFLEFKKYQKEIEDIAHSPENLVATKVLLNDAAPQASIMLESITNLINLEMKQPASNKRKMILGTMADVRGNTARSLANVRAYLLSGDGGFQAKFNVMWDKNIKRVKDLKSYKGDLTGVQKKEFDKFFSAREKFAPLPQKMFDIRGGKDWNLANKWLGTKAAPIAFEIKQSVNKMLKNQTFLMVTDGANSNQLVSSLIQIEYILLGLSVFLTLAITYLVSSSVNNVLNTVTGKTISSMGEITGLSDRISSASQALSASTEQQAASVHETSTTMNEIEAMVKRNMDETKKSSELASNSFSEVNSGADKIKQMIESISDIQKSNEKVESQVNISNEKMSEISTIIKTIGEKTQIINEIVLQTKLLSFNASVEAARAGEMGKGFAVVAEEVGNLAQMSGKASSEISEMLELSISSVDKVVKEQKRDMEALISESRSSTEKGIKSGEESEAILASILSIPYLR